MADLSEDQAINICEIASNLLRRFEDAHLALSLSTNAKREIADLEAKKAAVAADWKKFKVDTENQKIYLIAEMAGMEKNVLGLKAKNKAALADLETKLETKTKEFTAKLVAAQKDHDDRRAVLDETLRGAIHNHAENMDALAKERKEAEETTASALRVMEETKSSLATFLSEMK